MGKMTTFLLVISGTMLLFHLTGLVETGTTPNSVLLGYMLNPESLENSNFNLQIVLALEGLLAIAGAVVIGVITKNFELSAVAPVAIFLFNTMFDIIIVFNKVREANPVLAIVIFGPFMLLFVITTLDWWRGRD